MIRQHITILDTQPDGDILRAFQTKAGFRVFFEKHTGLFYLDAPDSDNPKRPSFGRGAGYEAVLNQKTRYDFPQIDRFVRQQIQAKTLLKHQFNADVMQDAVFLSDIFQMRVLCAYHDDEDVDIMALGNKGNLERLCFSAVSREQTDGEMQYFEVIYLPDQGPKLEEEINEFEGHNSIYQREFVSAFNKTAPDLFFFGQIKPSKDALKLEAKKSELSQAALLRFYGQFKLVDSEERKIHPALERLYGGVEIALKIVLVPIALIVVLVDSIRDDIKHGKNRR